MSHRTRGHIDAKDPLRYICTRGDAAIGMPQNSAQCALSIGAMRVYGFEEFIVYRTVAYGLLPGVEHYLKWQTTELTRDILEQYDINKRGAEKRIPKEGIEVTFLPLNKAHSTEYLQSEERRLKKNLSAKNRKDKKKRSYRISDPLTLQGVRWGTKQKT